MLTIFECGQGDAMRLSFDNCIWADTPLYLDLGPSTFKNQISEKEIDLLLTHSHDDHILGSIIPTKTKIRNTFIPAYYPELLKIFKTLTNKAPKIIKKISNLNLLYEGAPLGNCSHATVLNPPLDPLLIFNLSYAGDNEIENKRRQIEIDAMALLSKYDIPFDSILSADVELPEYEVPEEYMPNQYIMAALSIISKYDKGSLDLALYKFNKYDANKMSVVFSYQNEDGISYLFTGDADKAVFNRIIKKDAKSLKCDFLKVPHHGSKHSLSYRILNAMSPSIAVVSHDNGIFGTAKDPHPNLQTISMLKRKNVTTYYTNDVFKNGIVVTPRHQGTIHGFPINIT